MNSSTSVGSDQPSRSFTDTGLSVAARIAVMMSAASFGSRMSAAPLKFETILYTGQPMLMSNPSGEYASSIIRAASAIDAGSAPKSCWMMGRSSGTKRPMANDFSLPWTRPSALIISRNTIGAANRLAMRQNAESVMSAIGERAIIGRFCVDQSNICRSI
ncbi:MAG: hypothetical protein RL272_1209 [Candidatus Parcubacteria bacterium]